MMTVGKHERGAADTGAEDASATEEGGWLGKEPDISPEEISGSFDADIVVIGSGLAGVAAARRATELGAEVFMFEKCKGPQARSGDFAAMNSKVAAAWGRDNLDLNRVVSTLMKDMCYKPSMPLLKNWADKAGPVFDWFVEALPDIHIAGSTAEPIPEGARCWIQPRRYPSPKGFDLDTEYYPSFETTVWIRPSVHPVFNANYALAENSGRMAAFFGCPVKKLLRDEAGRVTGAVGRTTEGKYIKASAAMGVILATGDYSGDDAMLYHYCPWTRGIPRIWTSYDAEKKPSNTGDGHRMGLWAGALMQETLHAPMTHHMGGPMGNAPFLHLNMHGRRFMNEDVPGQQLHNQIEIQPGKISWQIYDSDWKKYIPFNSSNHASGCYYFEQEDIESGKIYKGLNKFDCYCSDELLERAVAGGDTVKADTLEDLIDKMALPREAALCAIERYNRMAYAGRDEDFGKAPKRLSPIEKEPFFATRFEPAHMLVCLGGLESDADARCLDADRAPIPGFYVAGNVQGNRFSIEYPTTVCGISHSMALTFGYIAAETAVGDGAR